MMKKEATDDNMRRIICACCHRDITKGYVIVWKGEEPLCYDCANKRVKREEKTDAV